MRRLWIPIISTFAVLSVVLLVIDAGVLPALIHTSDAIDTVLVVSLFFGILFRYEWGLLTALTAGLLVDGMRLTPLRETLALLAALVAVNTLFRLFFTNRSLWTLIMLGGIATILTRAVSAMLSLSFDGILRITAVQIITHSMTLSVLFLLTWVMGTRLKSYLLVRRS